MWWDWEVKISRNTSLEVVSSQDCHGESYNEPKIESNHEMEVGLWIATVEGYEKVATKNTSHII